MTSQEQLYLGQPPPVGTAAVNPLLPPEFTYVTAQVPLNDPSRFYIPLDQAGHPPSVLPRAAHPVEPPTIPKPAAQPLLSPDYQGDRDKQWPLNQDLMRNDEGSYGPTWLIDRGAALASSTLAATRFDPTLALRLPVGHEWPTVASMQSISRNEWQRFLPSQYGKLLGGALVADTLIDQMFLADRTSSAATLAVDVGVPMAARWLLSRYSLPISLGLSIASHVAEKYFLEDKR